MSGRREVRAIGPSYQLPNRKAGVQRSVNCYVSMVEAAEDKPAILKDSDGWDFFVSAADLRGHYSTGDRYFIVDGLSFYEVSTTGSKTLLYTFPATNSGFVSMRHNATQLAIVDTNRLFVFTLASNAMQEVSAGWQGSDWVDYIDGYFTFVRPDSEQFYLSAIDDGTSLDALDFSSADRQPDNLVTHRVFKGEIYLFGSKSVEPWVNSGGSDFPFARYNGAPIEVGLAGKRAVAVTTDALVWVDSPGIVYAMSAYQPIRISTQDQETKLRLLDLSQCVCWTYLFEGAEHVGIEHPDLEATLVFDVATKQWHERAHGAPTAWAPLNLHSVVLHKGRHYTSSNGQGIVRRNHDSQEFDGNPIVRSRTWPHLMQPSMEPIQYRGLEIDCNKGTGGNCYLQVSNDGGYTFGAPLIRSLGVTGRRNQRVRWLGLGASEDRVFHIACSDAVPFNLASAAVDA